MDEDTILFCGFLSVIFAICFTICYAVGMDKKQERLMAEKGYCYQLFVQPGSSGWQYQKCK